MAWRTISIENPGHLSLKDNKLQITQEQTVALPLEDIDTLIVDEPSVTLTAKILLGLAQFGVNVILCNERHLPAALILPYSQASRGSKYARAQIAASSPLKKQLWRKNIIQKINNQADVLATLAHTEASRQLQLLARTVRSGDVGNNESIAASLYFNTLLGDATRRQPLWFNSALNYAYAIVRGSLARALAGRGLICELGIHHHSELNQYNLADDLIEAFRPLVDYYVVQQVAPRHLGDEYDSALTKEDRHLLLDISNQYATILDKRYSIKHLTEKVAESLVGAFLDDDPDALILPALDKV